MLNLRLAILVLAVIWLPLLDGKVNLSGVAAATTVAVNAGEMAKWIRHPKRQAKITVKAVKETIKGKK